MFHHIMQRTIIVVLRKKFFEAAICVCVCVSVSFFVYLNCFYFLFTNICAYTF